MRRTFGNWDMHAEGDLSGGKRVGERGAKFVIRAAVTLLRSLRCGRLRGVYSKVAATVPRLDAIAVDLHVDAMEFAVPTRGFGIIAEGVVASAVGITQGYRPHDVIVIVKRQAAGFLGEVLHGLMRFDGGVMGIGKLVCNSLRIV